MRARVRRDDETCSNWFEADQGLRQGGNLARLLLNIFFIAVLAVAVEAVSRDKKLQPDMVVISSDVIEGRGKKDMVAISSEVIEVRGK